MVLNGEIESAEMGGGYPGKNVALLQCVNDAFTCDPRDDDLKNRKWWSWTTHVHFFSLEPGKEREILEACKPKNRETTWVVAPLPGTVANEGLGWDPLLKM